MEAKKIGVLYVLGFFGELGEKCHGKYQLRMDVGGITCTLIVPNEEQYAKLKERYANFLCDDQSRGASDITIDVFERGGKWDIHSFPEIEVHYIDSRHYALRWDFFSEFDAATGKGRYISIPNTNILSIDAFVRISYSLLAVSHGGFLIHSASIVRNGGGYLFSGVSDAGKTTVSRISLEEGRVNDTKVLTDEISLVKPNGGGYNVYGTPFWGELQHGLPESSELKGVMFLIKDDDVFLSKLAKKDAIKKLMLNVLFFAKDSALSKKLFQNCFDAIMYFDCFDLHFLPDNSFWRCIDEQYSQ